MKNIILMFSFLVLLGCKKEEIVTPAPTETGTLPKDPAPVVAANDNTLLLSGSFMTEAHTTTGTAKIFEDNKTKKQSLVFEGFKTDAGPDLRIYLAEDTKAKNFVEVTDKVKNGDTTLEIPTTFDAKKQIYVLIWCKQFGVLFGSAKLK